MDARSLFDLQETLRQLDTRSRGDDADGVWAENWAIVQAFLTVTTQWRVAAIGGGLVPGRLIVMGFDYAGVCAGLHAAGIAATPELWRGLRIMEEAAAAALNEGS
jgi:hypothetical protein